MKSMTVGPSGQPPESWVVFETSATFPAATAMWIVPVCPGVGGRDPFAPLVRSWIRKYLPAGTLPVRARLFVHEVPPAEAYWRDIPERLMDTVPRLCSSTKSFIHVAPGSPP